MDFEQLFSQTIISFFTILFIGIVYLAHYMIEKAYRKTSKTINQTKLRVKKTLDRETLLCKKVLSESTNRQHRSIMASSLMQTLDEELQRLQHISESIKKVQQLPNFVSNFETRFHSGTQVVHFNNQKSQGDSDIHEPKKVLKQMQSKRCKTYGVHTTNELRLLSENERKTRKQKSSEIDISLIKSQRLQKKLELPKSVGLLCSPEYIQNKKYSETEKCTYKNLELAVPSGDRLLKTQSVANVSSDDCTACSLKKKSISCDNVIYTIKEKPKGKLQTKKHSIFSYSSGQSFDSGGKVKVNILKNSSNSSNILNKMIIPYDDITGYPDPNTSPIKSKCDSLMTHIHHTKSKDHTKTINLMTRHNNECIQFTDKFKLIQDKKVVSFKVLKKCGTVSNYAHVCIFKVPIKLNKKKITLKFVINLVVKTKMNCTLLANGSKIKQLEQFNKKYYTPNSAQTKLVHNSPKQTSYNKQIKLYTNAQPGSATEKLENCITTSRINLPTSAGDGIKIPYPDCITMYKNYLPLSIVKERQYEYLLKNKFENTNCEKTRNVLEQITLLSNDNMADFSPHIQVYLPLPVHPLFTFANESLFLCMVEDNLGEKIKNSSGNNICQISRSPNLTFITFELSCFNEAEWMIMPVTFNKNRAQVLCGSFLICCSSFVNLKNALTYASKHGWKMHETIMNTGYTKYCIEGMKFKKLLVKKCQTDNLSIRNESVFNEIHADSRKTRALKTTTYKTTVCVPF